jgi:hypothetical protein
MDWSDPSPINALDGQGYTVLEGLSAGGTLSPTASRPNKILCVDGRYYWVKGGVQQGLVAELVAGRLANQVGVGPQVQIIRVTEEAVPADGSLNHLLGVVVGSRDQPNMVNARDLAPLIGANAFPAGAIDAQSRVRVIAFHTWLGMGDAQVLVGVNDGRVLSIDHGDCFAHTADTTSDPVLILCDIQGFDVDDCRKAHFIQDAIEHIEAITDHDLVRAVAQIPAGQPWSSPVDRRLGIARWIAARRDKLRSVLEPWAKL